MRKERTLVRFIYSYHGHETVRVVLIVPQEFLTLEFQATHFTGRCCNDFWWLSFVLFTIGDHFSIVTFGISYHFIYKFMFIHLFQILLNNNNKPVSKFMSIHCLFRYTLDDRKKYRSRLFLFYKF